MTPLPLKISNTFEMRTTTLQITKQLTLGHTYYTCILCLEVQRNSIKKTLVHYMYRIMQGYSCDCNSIIIHVHVGV